MHQTQRHILQVLKRESPRRYRDLIPAGLDGNTFTHHLRTVCEAGLVAHLDETYSLTVDGMRLVDGWSSKTGSTTPQPKVMVEVAYQNETGEWLMVEQLNEPFRGKVGFPCGRLHIGERLLDAATHEFHEQTGLVAEELAYYGCIAMETRRGETLLNHLITHVFKTERATGNLRTQSTVGRPFFAKIENLENTFEGLSPVLTLVTTGKPQPINEYVFETD